MLLKERNEILRVCIWHCMLGNCALRVNIFQVKRKPEKWDRSVRKRGKNGMRFHVHWWLRSRTRIMTPLPFLIFLPPPPPSALILCAGGLARCPPGPVRDRGCGGGCCDTCGDWWSAAGICQHPSRYFIGPGMYAETSTFFSLFRKTASVLYLLRFTVCF